MSARVDYATAAVSVGVSERTIRRWVARGWLTAVNHRVDLDAVAHVYDTRHARRMLAA